MKLDPSAGPLSKAAHRLQWSVELLAVEIVYRATGLLPFPLRLALGRALGRLVYRIDGGHRRVALDNLALAFPDATPAWREDVAKRSFEHLGRLLLEILRVGSDAGKTLQRSEVRGEEHLAAVTAGGRGYFLTSAHFGNWELAAFRQATAGHPVWMIARPLDNPWLEERFRSRREKTGNKVVHKRQAVREMMKGLRQGAGIALIIDQNFPEPDGHFVPFFGRDASTAPTLGMLSVRMQVPVLPLFAFPKRDGGYVFEYQPPVYPPEERSDDAMLEMTRRVTAIVEDAIRREPGAWFWMHRRWKTRPAEVSGG